MGVSRLVEAGSGYSLIRLYGIGRAAGIGYYPSRVRPDRNCKTRIAVDIRCILVLYCIYGDSVHLDIISYLA
jgi:hypothetical protein